MTPFQRSRTLMLGCALLAGAALAAPTFAADPARGKSKFEEACAECHAPADLKGPAAAPFAEKLQEIAAGKAKHRPKLNLSAEEVADLAGYLATLK